MKVKQQPEDFRVQELPLVSARPAGRYRFYKLTKRGLGTLEAVDLICRRWNVAGRRVSYGGLKDRHALTVQYLTIFEGPAVSIENPTFSLEYLGRLDHPYRPADFRGNRFVVVLRDLSLEGARRARDLVGVIASDGLPNYFDDQRFGSVGASGEFIAHAWLRGDAQHGAAARAGRAQSGGSLGGQSAESHSAGMLGPVERGKGPARALADAQHRDVSGRSSGRFSGAFARMRRELRTLFFSAFQSHLWNLMLARVIERATRPEQRVMVALKAGSFPFPNGLEPDQVNALKAEPIPLPSSRNALPEGTRGQIVQDVLADFQLTWPDLRVRHLKDVFFSKGSRPARNVSREPGSRDRGRREPPREMLA